MATRRATLRVILEMLPDTGEQPIAGLDTSELPSGPLVLAGFQVSRVESILLAAAAADQAVAFTDAAAVILISDTPFDLRVTAAQTLLEDMLFFAVWSDSITHGVHQTSVLLSGNGTDPSRITAFVLEKYAP